MEAKPSTSLKFLHQQIVACTACPRLIQHCGKVALEKRRQYRDHDYWGKPVPGFGDSRAQLFILGLAPGAHGANRTGRVFTGDSSGDFLYLSLHRAGFASQPSSVSSDDGLVLRNCYISAALRCAPPQNKPLPKELANCRHFLESELRLLKSVRAVLCLGKIAFDTYLRLVWNADTFPPRSSFEFAHGTSYALPGGLPRLFASYHPSRQNTQTGLLTPQMFNLVLEDIRRYLAT